MYEIYVTKGGKESESDGSAFLFRIASRQGSPSNEAEAGIPGHVGPSPPSMAAAVAAQQQQQAAAALQALQAQQQLLHQEGNFQPVRSTLRRNSDSIFTQPLICARH